MIENNINTTKKNMIIASVGARIGGGLIDLVIFLIFSIVFGYVTGLGVKPDQGVGFSLTGWPFIFYIILYIIVYSIFEFIAGKSPGKFVVRTHVVTEDYKKLSLMVTDVLNNPEKYSSIKKEARKTIVDNYDLEKVCLPKQIEIFKKLLK